MTDRNGVLLLLQEILLPLASDNRRVFYFKTYYYEIKVYT
jgi:hypothetical protein